MRIALFILVLLVPFVAGQQVVVNSQDWRDVYTGLQYAAVQDLRASFVVDTTQGTNLATRLGTDTDILLITGREQAMPGFRSLIQSRGYIVEEFRSVDARETNQVFALRAPTKNIVVVDDAYGYAATGVATYAKMRGASVLFADPGVVDVIAQKEPEEILLYGHIPSRVRELLEEYPVITINTQDRFDDNFALVKRFVSFRASESLILSNGEFIELQIITGDTPLLFIGRQAVPDEVLRFIREEEFRSAVLVGNALVPNAVTIKDETGIGIFIKFAQGRDQRQFSLDLFDIPVPQPVVRLTLAEYDPTSQMLLVTFTNPGDVVAYVSASFETATGTIDTESPVFVEAGTYKTVLYPSTEPGERVPYTALFGASPNSLEYILQGVLNVSRVTIEDRSELLLLDASYSPKREEFRVQLKNPGTMEVFALVELADVRIGDDRIRLAAPVTRIPAGAERAVTIPATLSERDRTRNAEIAIEVFYGQREFSLVRVLRETRAFSIADDRLPFWLIGVALGVALVFIVWFRRRKRRG